MLRRGLWSVAAVALIASVASAQGQGQRRGFGGFGGFGGPGGNVGLLGFPEVQKELGLSDEQKKEVEDLRSQVQQRAGGARTNFQELQNLSQEEREKAFAEARKNAEAAAKESDERLGKILDEKQLARLNQLRLQQEGVAAFNREDVAKKLELTEEQQEKIRSIQQEARRNFGGGFANFQDLSDEERQKLFAEMQQRREKTEADILAVLTEEQQEKWTAMKGKEFKFPQRRPGGGFGGPGGFGGGQNQPRRRPEQKPDNPQ